MLLGNMVTNVCAKFNHDRLRIDKVSGNWKSDDNKTKQTTNVRSAWGLFADQKSRITDLLYIQVEQKPTQRVQLTQRVSLVRGRTVRNKNSICFAWQQPITEHLQAGIKNASFRTVSAKNIVRAAAEFFMNPPNGMCGQALCVWVYWKCRTWNCWTK